MQKLTALCFVLLGCSAGDEISSSEMAGGKTVAQWVGETISGTTRTSGRSVSGA